MLDRREPFTVTEHAEMAKGLDDMADWLLKIARQLTKRYGDRAAIAGPSFAAQLAAEAVHQFRRVMSSEWQKDVALHADQLECPYAP
jgi:hypothetical protein